MSPVYTRIKGSLSLGEGDEPDFEIECVECKCRFCPRDPITHDLELRKGQLYIVECPRCEHAHIVRQLAEGLDDDAA